MALPAVLQKLALPVVASPMFIVSYPELVLAQCKAGIVGSFPALNARPAELLDEWLTQIQAQLAEHKAATPDAVIGPIAVNQIVHQSNTRLEHDVRVCVEHKVPIFITSLRAPAREIVDAVHSYGGIVLHDVINLRHAQKALEAGVDGLILVASGAGGHAGTTSPFALVGEVRRMFDGPIVLSGSIANGGSILAAQAMGADLAYMGTRFIATKEAHAVDSYKQAIVNSTASDIIYTRAWQLPSRKYPERGAGPGRAAGIGQDQDELRQRQGEGVERHLGRRPGRRPDGRRAERERTGAAFDEGI
jgi:nitronate monooxygenase